MKTALKRATPWQAKIALKLAISRLPVGHDVWKRLGIFEHSAATPVEYIRIPRLHVDALQPARPFSCLELGPGDSIAGAVVLAALGAAPIYLVDVGRFADRNLEPYRAVARELTRQGFEAPDLENIKSFDELLDAWGAVYLTGGQESLRSIASESIDVSWSHAVLEHVRASEFEPLTRELYRIASPGGTSSHAVDLQDHFSGRLDNLRFSSKTWESDWMSSGGFYTNRLQHQKIVDLFVEAGFSITSDEVTRWPELPTPRSKLDAQFQNIDEDDLRVSTFGLRLRKQ